MTRRAPLVIGATVAGLVGVLSFHSRGDATPAAAGASGAGARAPAGGSSTGTGSAADGSAADGSAADGSAGTGAGGSGAGAGGSGVGSGSSSASPTTVSGAVEEYGYGELAVSVTLSGLTITDVSVPTLEVEEPPSQQIADEAIPVLRREVLSAQSADIDVVSGATQTSRAYIASLQSALDRAGRS